MLLLHEPLALATLARVRDEAPGAVAARARLLDGERKHRLLQAHTAFARTRAAGRGHGSRSRAASATVFAQDDATVAQRLLRAERGLGELEFELEFEVAAVALAHAKHAEQVAENALNRDVAEVDHTARKRTVGAEGRAGLFGQAAGAIERRATLRIAEDLVSLVDLFEANRRRRIVLIAIGMVLRRETAKRSLHLVRRRVAREAENFVRVACAGRHACCALSGS